MSLLFRGERPPAIDDWLAERQRLGQDRFDETFATFPFFAAHGVEEIVVADPATRTVRVCQLRVSDESAHEETGRSDLLDVTGQTLTDAIDWP